MYLLDRMESLWDSHENQCIDLVRRHLDNALQGRGDEVQVRESRLNLKV